MSASVPVDALIVRMPGCRVQVVLANRLVFAIGFWEYGRTLPNVRTIMLTFIRWKNGACAAIVLAIAPLLFAQAPTAEAIKVLQTKYAEEKAKSVADGAARSFLPGLFERADDIARK